MRQFFQKNSAGTGSSGQILVEVMIALAVVVTAFTGVLSLLGTTLSMTRVVSGQYVGTYLAAEGVEIVKNIVDQNYFEDLDPTGSPKGMIPFNRGLTSGTYYLDYKTDAASTGAHVSNDPLQFDGTYYSYGSGSETTTYKRAIQIQSAGDSIQVSVTVDWQAKGGSYSVTLGDVFRKWW